MWNQVQGSAMATHLEPAGTAGEESEGEGLVRPSDAGNSEFPEDGQSDRAEPVKRLVRSVGGGGQAELFEARRRTPGKPKRRRRVGFIDPDPGEIFIGETRLDSYLRLMELDWVVGVRELLRELDWTEFEARYLLTGRSPYAPAAMMGLVLYGTMLGMSSLRDLEGLARRDLGAMWLTGGICPDHACLGRFVNRHEESITTEFFEGLTERIIRRLGSPTKQLAGDATIVEAAASRSAGGQGGCGESQGVTRRRKTPARSRACGSSRRSSRSSGGGASSQR
jgi:transposase